jgi:hypothetical protein
VGGEIDPLGALVDGVGERLAVIDQLANDVEYARKRPGLSVAAGSSAGIAAATSSHMTEQEHKRRGWSKDYFPRNNHR